MKKIMIIINPASGVDTPILPPMNRELQKLPFAWEIRVTTKEGDATVFTKEALKKNFDIIGVYGGDGTVTEVAQLLYKTSVPLLILPGGSANVIAKDLGIPTDLAEAVQVLKKYKVIEIDMALVNKNPVLMGYNIGTFAKHSFKTKSETKDRIGNLAYGLTAVKSLGKMTRHRFTLTMDGKKEEITAAALLITNVGNLGISGLTLSPLIQLNDGLLDIVAFESLSVTTLVDWAQMHLNKKKHGESIKHWQAQSVSGTISPKAISSLDDTFSSISSFSLTVSPKTLSVIVPK